MNIIKKFMNALRLDKEDSLSLKPLQKAIEFDCGENEEHIPSKILYKDRYFSNLNYKDIGERKTIFFNGRNFNVPEVQLCSALLLKFSKKGMELRKNKDYPSYYQYKYGLMNVEKLHSWLYEKEYLRKATVLEILGTYKVDELKIMLGDIGLPKTGNKPILIKRIADHLDNNANQRLLFECRKLFLTEKGSYFLDENYDYVLYHEKQYGVQFSEFERNRNIQGRKRKFHDTIFQVLSEKAFVYQRKQWLSQLGWIYNNLSDCLYDERRYDLSLQNAIYVLYFDANMASLVQMFNIDVVRNNDIENLIDDITQKNIFSDWIILRIINLKDYFDEQMVDVVYSGNILPYCLFERNECADFIYDLIENDIDFNYYLDIIKENYTKYIKQFV